MEKARMGIAEYAQEYGKDPGLSVSILTLIDDASTGLRGVVARTSSQEAHRRGEYPLRSFIEQQLGFAELADNILLPQEQCKLAMDICEQLEENQFAQPIVAPLRRRLGYSLFLRSPKPKDR